MPVNEPEGCAVPIGSTGVPDPLGDDPWVSNQEVIRRFEEQRPHFERLSEEVRQTMAKLLEGAGIKVAAVSARTKGLDSFLEKVLRKSYADPFAETTDFAGVRVTCFYRDDLRKVENLIYDEFPDANKAEDVLASNIDRFGYSASHFLVQLKERAPGCLCDDLKGKTCEIQVRTVLQDAWAMFSHDLLYKYEHLMPDSLKRQCYALAGALETADVAFQTIRDQRNGYVRSSTAHVDRMELGKPTTNSESLKEYLGQKYPYRPVDPGNDFLGFWFSRMPLERYPTLRQVDELLDRTETARNWVYRGLKKARKIRIRYSVFELAWALALVHREIRDSNDFADQVGTLVLARPHFSWGSLPCLNSLSLAIRLSVPHRCDADGKVLTRESAVRSSMI